MRSRGRTLAFVPVSFVLLAAGAAAVDIAIDDTVVAPKCGVGVGVNGGGGWYNLVGANLVNNSCFEGPDDGNGFSKDGWPWWIKTGTVTPSVDGSTYASGSQSQKLVVTAAPAEIQQTRVELPQEPLVMRLVTTGSYVVKTKIRASGPAKVRLGFVKDDWTSFHGPDVDVTTNWKTCSWSYTPPSDTPFRGFALRLMTNATYWVDDFVAWNANDVDPATGLSAKYVARLKDMKPAMLRLGGLGVNPIPLESYLFGPWDLSYAPPAFLDDMGLNTFLRTLQDGWRRTLHLRAAGLLRPHARRAGGPHARRHPEPLR
jgi:hypothetical protein